LKIGELKIERRNIKFTEKISELNILKPFLFDSNIIGRRSYNRQLIRYTAGLILADPRVT